MQQTCWSRRHKSFSRTLQKWMNLQQRAMERDTHEGKNSC